ncbi:MAG: hypothetical protein ACI81R_000580 [Bradymonadia bacterium]|jgi:hypothetical protein
MFGRWKVAALLWGDSVKFNVSVADPKGYPYTHFLYDLTRFLVGGLRDLGHHVVLSRGTLSADAVNILVGGHLIASPPLVAALQRGKVPYVVVQGEMVTGAQLNNDGDTERFRAGYLELLKNAVDVWEFSEMNQAALSALGVSSQRVRLGYTSACETIELREPDIDVFFYGSITQRRRDVLKEVAESQLGLHIAFDDDAFFRDDKIARAKTVLTLRQSDDMGHVPRARIKFLVNNGVLVVGEPGVESHSVDGLYIQTERDSLVETLREWCAGDRARDEGARVKALLVERPMSAELAPAVERLNERLATSVRRAA